MPNVRNTISGWIANGNPDTWYSTEAYTSSYAAGDMGTLIENNDRSYQRAYLDSGATSATTSGAVAANQLLYWKDRSKYIVTNDVRFALFNDTALSFRNNVAGVARAAVPAGSHFWCLQRARQINVKEAGSATAGMTLIASTSTTAADALGVAINTAPNCLTLGVVYTATANNVCVADVDIAPIP